MSDKHKHLEFIQGVVNRLAANSFQVKGWSVLLVSALFALTASGGSPALAWIALIPAVVFWGLDGYFLRQERLFRKLYDRVRLRKEAEIDFSMSTVEVATQVDGWFKVSTSKTLLPFHGTVTAIALVAAWVISYGC